MCVGIEELLNEVGGGRAYVIVPRVGTGVARRLLGLAAGDMALIITSPGLGNPLYTLAVRWSMGKSREALALGLVFASGALAFLALLLAPNADIGLLIGVGIILALGALAWRVAGDEPPQDRGWLINVRLMGGLDACLLIINNTAWYGRDCNHLCPVHPGWARRVFEEYWSIAEPITPLPPPQQASPVRE